MKYFKRVAICSKCNNKQYIEILCNIDTRGPETQISDNNCKKCGYHLTIDDIDQERQDKINDQINKDAEKKHTVDMEAMFFNCKKCGCTHFTETDEWYERNKFNEDKCITIYPEDTVKCTNCHNEQSFKMGYDFYLKLYDVIDEKEDGRIIMKQKPNFYNLLNELTEKIIMDFEFNAEANLINQGIIEAIPK